MLNVQHLLEYSDRLHVDDDDIRDAHQSLRHKLSTKMPAQVLSSYGPFFLEDSMFNHVGADMVVNMLAWDRFARPSPAALLQHKLFQEVFEA